MDSAIFVQELQKLFADATLKVETKITVKSGDLHRLVGGYPGENNRMPTCCNAMRSQMGKGDVIISQPPKGDGASLTIEYQLPRN